MAIIAEKASVWNHLPMQRTGLVLTVGRAHPTFQVMVKSITNPQQKYNDKVHSDLVQDSLRQI